MLQLMILEAIVQDQRITTKLTDCMTARLHAVTIHQHHHAWQITRQHVGFITPSFRVEQDVTAIAHLQRRLNFIGEDALQEGFFLTAITTRQDGHLAALTGQFASKNLHNRRLSRATCRYVAHANHLATQWITSHDANRKETHTQPNDRAKDLRYALQKAQQDLRPKARDAAICTLLLNQRDDIAFELFNNANFVLLCHGSTLLCSYFFRNAQTSPQQAQWPLQPPLPPSEISSPVQQ